MAIRLKFKLSQPAETDRATAHSASASVSVGRDLSPSGSRTPTTGTFADFRVSQDAGGFLANVSGSASVSETRTAKGRAARRRRIAKTHKRAAQRRRARAYARGVL